MGIVRDRVRVAEMPDIHRWRPAGAASRILIGVHGIMSHAGWFDPLASALCQLGIEFWGIDRRGSGEARDVAGNDEPALLIDDVHRAVEAARRSSDAVTLLGWCWGARAAIIACANGCPVSELVLAAPGLAAREQVKQRRERILEDTSTNTTLPLPIDDDAFSADPAVLRFIRDDTLRWRDQPRKFPPRSQELLARALESIPNLRQRCLCVLAADDRIVDNDKVAKLMIDHRVVVLPGGHALILEDPARVAGALRDWLASSERSTR